MRVASHAPFQPFPLCFVTHPDPSSHNAADAVVDAVMQAMDGGARFVQYRDKNASRREMYQTAKQLREITAKQGVVLIVNDQVDLALAVGADGVHLGQDDLPVWVARAILGNGAIVGVSTHGVEEALRAEHDGADYIGFGPIFETRTKVNRSGGPVGIAAIAQVKCQVGIPLYAIGGIQRHHLPKIMAAGADGVAAISALSHLSHPSQGSQGSHSSIGNIAKNVREWITDLGVSTVNPQA